ncbi:hypothetical protein AYO21_06370 [Fonsecaea monophora]|uniref:DUF3533 domain-containing protein n=1 Tax=Fonsecaea monophora TaxID=254056 RepID=A0A177F537_9EURO|nr:hypothetical protein AYO21_06370 [Fonsecaea monophora]OAG39354.1 hypothetical protein AYO21_06370 [Fonsecaea monophora]
MRSAMRQDGGRQGKQPEQLTESSSGDIDDASVQYQAYHETTDANNSLCPDYALHCTTVRRFPSLNRSIDRTEQSSSTLAEKEQENGHNSKDLEETYSLHAPDAVGFFNPSLSQVRSAVFLKYSWTLALLCVFVLGVLSIYWGVLFRVRENLRSATIAVVDFDATSPPYETVEPIVGRFVQAAIIHERASQRYPLGYEFLDPITFRHDPVAVRLAVHEEKYWGAIIVNSNATALLRLAVESGNVSYDPFGAGQIVVNQARDIESYNQYITPVLVRLASDISFAFGREWTRSVLTNDTFAQSVYSNAPQALSPGIGFSIFNLRPFDPPTAIPAVSIGLIYLIIIAFFSFGFFVPMHMRFVQQDPSNPHPPLKFTHLIIWRYISTIIAYFLLSFCYSLVSLAFQIPFSRRPPHGHSDWLQTDVANNANHFGHATFVVYWMLNWLGMSALGLACESVAMVVGQPWTALWLIFWVITNVSTGFYALELAPGFFKWGYAWPLRQVVYASRTLLFDTRDRLGLNFGVLAAWVGIGTVLFPICCWIMRWKGMKAKRNLG